MVAFLEDVGMARILSRTAQFAELVAGGGRVIVHIAGGQGSASEHGLSHFCLITRRSDGLVEFGKKNGLDISVMDESYGRQGCVTGPGGEQISINEEQSDDYGYTRAETPQADARLSVSELRYSSDFERDIEFFRLFGFERADGDGVWWQGLRASAQSGVIGLHRPSSAGELSAFDSPDPVERVAMAQIGFATRERLEDLQARLQAAGHSSARIIADDAATRVHVVDPDGCVMEIHPESS